MDENIQLDGKSLFLFNINNKLRIFLYKLVHTYYFDRFITILIIITALVLSIDDPTSN